MQTIMTITILFFSILMSISSAQNTIQWAGYEWFLKDGEQMAPGPNNWKSDNVWVDRNNKLHLKLRRASSATAGNGWTCAELYTRTKFSFGTFRWFVEGPLDKLDRNVVFGLFTYGGADGTNEIDIEAAKWGRTEAEVHYTVYPHTLGAATPVSSRTKISLQGTYTTHRFTWNRRDVTYQSQHGFQNLPNQNIFFSYQTPTAFASAMPIISAPIHMNLWAFDGKPLINGEEVEIIIHDFKYTKA